MLINMDFCSNFNDYYVFICVIFDRKKILSTRPEYADYKLKVGVLSPELGFLKKLFK